MHKKNISLDKNFYQSSNLFFQFIFLNNPNLVKHFLLKSIVKTKRVVFVLILFILIKNK